MKIVTDKEQLHKVCREVKSGDGVAEVAALLFREMDVPRHGYPNAVGLAANQLGYSVRIFTMRYGNSKLCLVNPVLTRQKGTQVGREACMSLPGIEVELKRPLMATFKGLNQYMKPVKYKLRGLDARVACHELDHLNGILMTDYGEKSKTE